MMKTLLFTTLISLSANAALAATSPDLISVSAVGDIMMGTTSDKGRSYFAQSAELIKNSDIRFGNFEGTLYEGPAQKDGKTPGANRYLFQTPLDYVERLTESGFNVMSLANNHAKDFGAAGLLSTKQTLQLAGIQISSKDGEVAKFQIRGQNVSLIAVDFYKGNRSILTPQTTYSEISSLKQRGSLVIVSAHVGREGKGAEHLTKGEELYLGENRGDSVSFAHQAIDQGADLILMHGPHVPRGLEVYRGHLIVYSLGNFATGRGIDTNGTAGIAPLVQVEMDFQGKFVSGQIHSFVQVRPEATLVDTKLSALRLIRQLSEEDFGNAAPRISDAGLITP